jgi:hypothetical protein
MCIDGGVVVFYMHSVAFGWTSGGKIPVCYTKWNGNTEKLLLSFVKDRVETLITLNSSSMSTRKSNIFEILKAFSIRWLRCPHGPDCK